MLFKAQAKKLGSFHLETVALVYKLAPTVATHQVIARVGVSSDGVLVVAVVVDDVVVEEVDRRIPPIRRTDQEILPRMNVVLEVVVDGSRSGGRCERRSADHHRTHGQRQNSGLKNKAESLS